MAAAWGAALLAQEPAPAAKPAAAKQPVRKPPASGDSPSALPGEVKPELYLLPDADGKLQAVPGFKFEDFIRLYKLQNHLEQKDQKPSYTIERLTITGAAVAKRADLQVEIALIVHEEGWVRVPLRLPSVALTQQVKFDGPGEQFLEYDEAGEGYVSWIRSTPEKALRLIVHAVAPLTVAGGETQLKLNAPRVGQSKLTLEVPIENAAATLSDGGTLETIKAPGAGKTVLTAIGIGGEFQLAWREPDAQVASVPAVLEATGALLARIDSRSVNTEAKLTVRSFGGQFNQIRVRLPTGAQLISASLPNATAQGPIVEVKLDKKTNGPVELRLVTDRPRNAAATNEVLDFAGFEVLGAVRQWGHIGVQPVGSWQVLWGENRNVRQVDELPEAIRRDDLAGGFEYHAQPFSLTARVAPQKTRVTATPEYVFLVGAQQVQLQARVKYRVRGAKVRSVNIELPGWEIDELGPANLVRIDAAVDNDAPAFLVPFSQPLSGEFEVTLAAHRALVPEAKTIELELPRVQAEILGPATVAVLAADNVELSPTPDAMSGLSVPPLKPQLQLPERQQPPQYFRSETSAGKFVASLAVHAQSISTEVSGQVEIDEQEIRVEERLTFLVSYEPLDALTILAPAAVPLDKLKVSFAGQRLLPVPAPETVAGEKTSVVSLRVALPGARIGRCELLVAYAVPLEKLIPAATVTATAPLVMPGEGNLLRNQIFVSAGAGMTVAHRKGPWRVDEGSRAGSRPGGLSLVSDEPSAELALAVTHKDRKVEESTVVDRAWIQTWLTETGRQDRALFRFTTSERRIRLTLPQGLVRTGVELYLDGNRLAPETDGPSDVTFAMPTGATRRDHLLEARYYFPQRDSGTRISLSAPQLKPAVWIRRCYWQLIVPGSEHLVRSPGYHTREFRWTWSNLCWQRQPTLDESDLESWLGVSSAAPPAESSNRYLFSTVGGAADLELWTARRSVLVFSASLLVLAVGLLLIYVPAVRHPGLLLVTAILLLAGTILEPETAVLIAQSASLGLALAGLAALLARKSLRRPAAAKPVHGSSFAVRQHAGAEPHYRPARAGSHSSTATAPTAAAAASPEAQP